MATKKYIQNANRIMDALAEQPDKIWKGTQRDLCVKLELSQPELSNLVSLLVETGKIRKGQPLKGVRGRNYTLELVDASPLDPDVPRRAKPKDRALEPEEAVDGPIDLQGLTLEQIGAAVLRTLQQTWEKAERSAHMQSEYLGRIREYREQLSDERQFRTRMVTEKEKLEHKLEQKDEEVSRMRGEINKLIIKANQRRGNNSAVQVKDMLDDEELRMLQNLMKDKPGFYRESDKEIGLKTG